MMSQNPEVMRLAMALAEILGAGRPVAPPEVETFDYVTIELAATLSGLTVKAIQRKVQDGKWLEGKEWIRAPDGHIMISRQGVKSWVEKGQALKSVKAV